MKKIGLVLILVEIIALIIIGRQTAFVPNRPQIDAIQLQYNPADLLDEEVDISKNVIKASLFPNPVKSIKNTLQVFFSFTREKSVALAIDSQ